MDGNDMNIRDAMVSAIFGDSPGTETDIPAFIATSEEEISTPTSTGVRVGAESEQQCDEAQGERRGAYYEDGREFKPHEVIADWDLSYNLGTVVKYCSRFGRKYTDYDNMILDLQKARDYIDFEIQAVYKKKRRNGQ